VTLEDWECQICNQMNSGTDSVCVLCGVPKIDDKNSVDEIDIKPKKKKDATSKPPVYSNSGYSRNAYNDNDNLSSFSFTSTTSSKSKPLPTKPQQPLQFECPACTYINEGNVDCCKVCMTSLNGVKPLPPPRTKPVVCSICLYSNEPNATVCSICAMPLKYCATNFDSESTKSNNNDLFFSSSNTYFDSSSPVHYPDLAETSNISVPNDYDLTNPYSNISMGDISKESDDDDNISDISPITPSSSVASSQVSSLANLKEDIIKIKLLFKSGQTAFYNELSKTLKEEGWKVIFLY